jgi:hypothetical protein
MLSRSTIVSGVSGLLKDMGIEAEEQRLIKFGAVCFNVQNAANYIGAIVRFTL